MMGLGEDSINFRLPGKGVFERTRGRFGDCTCACAVFNSAHHEAICSLGPWGGEFDFNQGTLEKSDI